MHPNISPSKQDSIKSNNSSNKNRNNSTNNNKENDEILNINVNTNEINTHSINNPIKKLTNESNESKSSYNPTNKTNNKTNPKSKDAPNDKSITDILYDFSSSPELDEFSQPQQHHNHDQHPPQLLRLPYLKNTQTNKVTDDEEEDTDMRETSRISRQNRQSTRYKINRYRSRSRSKKPVPKNDKNHNRARKTKVTKP